MNKRIEWPMVSDKNTIPPIIYECHGKCGCKMVGCSNTVVQDGIRQNLEVFLTKNKGWGVRAREKIKKGEYLCTYTGLITPKNTSQTRDISFQHYLNTSAYKKYMVSYLTWYSMSEVYIFCRLFCLYFAIHMKNA